MTVAELIELLEGYDQDAEIMVSMRRDQEDQWPRQTTDPTVGVIMGEGATFVGISGISDLLGRQGIDHLPGHSAMIDPNDLYRDLIDEGLSAPEAAKRVKLALFPGGQRK